MLKKASQKFDADRKMTFYPTFTLYEINPWLEQKWIICAEILQMPILQLAKLDHFNNTSNLDCKYNFFLFLHSFIIFNQHRCMNWQIIFPNFFLSNFFCFSKKGGQWNCLKFMVLHYVLPCTFWLSTFCKSGVMAIQT